MSDRIGREHHEPQPWERDPDGWRNGTSKGRCAEPWPQLSAGPAYWMWLERFEQEHGIRG